MKKKKRTIDIIKKYAILLFCAITVTMNVVNYVQSEASKELGVLYKWNSGAQVAAENESSIAELSQNAEGSSKEKSSESVINTENPADVTDGSDNGSAAERDHKKLVNLNTASSEELQTISGIGPAKAKAIIEYRDKFGGFVVIDEIMEVNGIGEGIFAKIKDFIFVE